MFFLCVRFLVIIPASSRCLSCWLMFAWLVLRVFASSLVLLGCLASSSRIAHLLPL